MIPEKRHELKYRIPLIIIGLIGSGLISYLIRLHGAGIFPDSVYYISVARNIANGSGFVGYDGYYYVLQPPLYPVLLGAIKILLNTDPLISSGYVNAVLFGLTIYLAGLFFLKYLKSYTLVLLGTVSILISFVFIQITLTALSEPLFILLVLLFIYFLEKYYVKPDITSLIIFSTAASLACLTRYIGIVLILTGVISILIQNNRLFKEKIRRIAIFLFISCLPIGLWIIRNISLSGTFSGQRADSSYTLSENIKFLVNTILKWYLQIQITGLQVIIISIIIAVLLVLLIKRHKQKSLADINKLSPTLIFVLLYTLLLIISSTTTAYDYIANRLLSPIYIPVFLISFFITDNILIWLSKYYKPKVLTAFLAAGIIAWMIYPAAKTVYIINDYVKLSGFGFNSSSWDNLETINYLNKNKGLGTDYMVYSNVPEAVYILSNIKARWSPAKTLYNSPLTVNNESNLKYIFGRNNNICLVWFYKMDRNFLYSIDELQKNLNFEKIADFKDGSIYILRKVN